MSSKQDVLFTPIKIGSCEIKNRIFMAPMAGAFFIMGGKYNQNATTYYVERAKGGVGLIVPGISFVKDMAGNDVWFHDSYDEFVPNAKKMMEQIHSYGSKMFIQLGAGVGRCLGVTAAMVTNHGYDHYNGLTAPSEITNVFDPSVIHRGMTREEIQEIVEGFGKCAKMVKDADIDGIEIHAIHEGYLLDQFSIEGTNGRTDEYGGSRENRMRFVCDIIRKIKEVNGEDYPVIVRYSVTSKMKSLNSGALPGEPYNEFGRSLEESPAIARILQDAGCDGLNADNGSYDSWYWAHPPVYMPMGCNLPESQYIKHFVDIPVFCAGRMEDIDITVNALESGSIDAVSIGRQLIADPEWPNKVQNGEFEDIRPCIACHHGCFGRLFDGKGLGCAVNCEAVREKEYALKKAEQKKKIVIIGGGISGMEAARVAKTRGHDVVLFEKSGELGGVYIAAAAPGYKESDRKLIQWFRHMMDKLDIDVRLNTEATTESVKAESPDEIILATGATAQKLNVPGIESDKVVPAVDYLLGKEKLGKRVAVIGGGLTGCEIAYELAEEGHEVTVIEMQNEILMVPGLCSANSDMLRELLIYHNAKVIVNAKLKSIDKAGIIFEQTEYVSTTPKLKLYRANFKEFPIGEHSLECDSVVMATGYTPNRSLADALSAIAPVHSIGDCDNVGNLLSAVWDAYELAMVI